MTSCCRRPRRLLGGTLTLALLALAGCQPDTPSGIERIDLADHFFLAEKGVEIRELELGRPQARPAMVEGWSTGSERPGWGHFVWAIGERSALDLYLSYPRTLHLAFEAWSAPIPGSPPQEVEIRINGQELARRKLGAGPANAGPHRVEVPAALQVVGKNRLSFHYSSIVYPYKLHPDRRDTRPLAAAWRTLRVEEIQEPVYPQARSATADQPAALMLPFRTQVDYHLQVPRGGELVIEEIRASREAGEWRLEVDVVRDSGAGEARFEITSGRGPATISLAGSPDPVRLSLRASTPELTAPRTGLQLLDPHILLPPAPAAETVRPAAASPPPARARRPNILLYVIDTLRADRLGAYGHPRPTSPHLDALAQDGVLFTRAWAQASWTRPAMASLLTGLHPQRHGTNGVKTALTDEVPTLAERLDGAGYSTAAVVSNGHISPEFGFDRGFRHFERLPERPETRSIYATSSEVHRAAFAWLDQHDGASPFFLYLHSVDPHAPYTPPEPYRERFAAAVDDPDVGYPAYFENVLYEKGHVSEELRRDLMDLYDAEIAFNDATFGELIAFLRQRGLYDDTLVLVISDHGEEFYEHELWQHGRSLSEELIRIPLILKLPGSEAAGRRIDATAQQVDVLPTLLDAAGLPPPDDVQGRSLLEAIRRPDPGQGRDWKAYAYLGDDPDQREIVALMAGDLKLIYYPRYRRPHATLELFDLSSAAGEAENLASRRPVETGFLFTALRSATSTWRPGETVEVEISAETARAFRALGYLE